MTDVSLRHFIPLYKKLPTCSRDAMLASPEEIQPATHPSELMQISVFHMYVRTVRACRCLHSINSDQAMKTLSECVSVTFVGGEKTCLRYSTM